MLWSLLPVGLLALIFSSPALGEPTSPYNALHDISKLAQRPPEQPICCLTPLPSNEPAEEILSFEDWKAKQAQMHENDSSSRDTGRVFANVPNVNRSEQHQQQHSSEPQTELQASAPEPAPSPHFGVPLIDRFNYADLDCSARIRGSHRSAKHAISILSSKKDRYMLSPCKTPGEQQYVVVELCEDIRIDTVQFANFEFFSGVVKEFSVSVAQTDTPDPAAWTPAGRYTAKNIRGIQVRQLRSLINTMLTDFIQSFHPPISLRDFYRYIRIDFHSHYGNEFYCPLSLLRVYGLTHLDAWKWDLWEEESQKKRGEIEEPVQAPVISPPIPNDAVAMAKETVGETNEKRDKAPETIAEGEASVVSTLVPATKLSTPPSSEIREASAKSQSPSTVSDSSSIVTSFSQVSSQVLPVSSPVIVDTSSSSSAIIESSASESSHATQVAASSVSVSKPILIPTIVPHDSRVPAVVGAGESIYRTIMTRLGALEMNATLYLRYVEEQTRSMREALRRLEEDLGRLEGIGKAHAQHMQRATEDWAAQRRRLEREHGELERRFSHLADEVVLEKRLGIAQLCLLLTVLVFMALTRGSRGETLIASSSRRDSLREWGRRHLSSLSGGEWTKFGGRTRSPTPTPKNPNVKNLKPTTVIRDDGERVPFPDSSHSRRVDEDRTPQRRTPVQSLSSPSKPRLPTHIRSPVPRHLVAHRPGTPSSISYHGHSPRSPNLVSSFGHINGLASGLNSLGHPRLRRSSSHNSPTGAAAAGLGVVQSFSVGPSPLSAKKWAKSAHLHEIRPTRTPRVGLTSATENDQAQVTQGALQALVEMSPTKVDHADKTPEDSKNQSIDADVFWPSMHSRSPMQVGSDSYREPLAPLQNRARDASDTARTLDAQAAGLTLHSQWHPSPDLGSPTKFQDIDTESESWVDTDVEGSDAGDSSRELRSES